MWDEDAESIKITEHSKPSGGLNRNYDYRRNTTYRFQAVVV